MTELADRQSVTKTRCNPAPRKVATRLWPGAKSEITAPWRANGAHTSVGIPLAPVEKSRNRTVAKSSAILFRVAHVGSWVGGGESGPTAKLANSLAITEARLLADAA